MGKVLASTLMAAAAALVAGAPAYADHSLTMFDMQRTQTVQGRVEAFQYTDPHSWLLVRQPSARGEPQLWSFETGPQSDLLRRGVKVRTYKPGDLVTVRMHPMRDGRQAGRIVDVVDVHGVSRRLTEE